ncbi:nucleotidyltransferase [Sporolactobacillus sp. THM7-4]|nr:nucleotidyltransferase [Sporolactobacillus sp. THM7-4]
MLTAGIIVEYNPFHNGHLYHLKSVRRMLDPDLVVAVMSGDFLQRGEPALVTKWDRVRMALQAGVDLVIELPYIFAVGKADTFARGAVSVLEHLGVNHLVFGSENGRIEPFLQTQELIQNNRARYERILLDALEKGISYPNAHAAAYRHLVRASDKEWVDLTRPNNSLGFQYVRAIREMGSSMIPVTLKRKETDHNDPAFSGTSTIASAKSIRNHLLGGGPLSDLQGKLPPYVYSALKQKIDSHRITDWETFFPFLKYRLLSTGSEQLSEIYEAEEGIENRLLSHITAARNFHEFISSVKTKRYTWARLQRLSVHILTNTKKEEARQPADSGDASYLRLLGMNSKGQNYLALIRKKLQIPLIAKIKKHHPRVMDLDIRSASIYDFLSGSSEPSPALTETSHAPVRFDEKKGLFLE